MGLWRRGWVCRHGGGNRGRSIRSSPASPRTPTRSTPPSGRGAVQRTVFEPGAVPLRGLLRAPAPAGHQRRRAQRHPRSSACSRRPTPSRARTAGALDPRPRPARPHPAAPPGVERLHRPPRRAPARPGPALVAELLDDIAVRGGGGEPVDLIAGFAFPLPFVGDHELLGMPEGDRVQLRRWSHPMTRSLEPLIDPKHLAGRSWPATTCRPTSTTAIDWKRRNPADDLLSALIAAEEDGDRLTTEELVDQVRLLYLAGHETTVNLIGNGTLALLRHRDQLERLVADPVARRQRRRRAAALRQPGADVAAHRLDRASRSAGETVAPGELVLTPAGWPTATPATGARPPATSTSAARAPAPPVLRQRHPPLPGRGAGPPGGRRGDPGPDPPVPRHGAGHRRARLERPDHPAGPRHPHS